MPQLAVAMAERRGADETSRRLEEQLRSELHAAVERVKPFEAKGVELQRACDMMHEERHRMSRELQHALASVRGLEENLNAVSSEKRQVNHPTTYRPPRLPRSLLTLLPLVPRGMRSSPSSLGATWQLEQQLLYVHALTRPSGTAMPTPLPPPPFMSSAPAAAPPPAAHLGYATSHASPQPETHAAPPPHTAPPAPSPYGMGMGSPPPAGAYAHYTHAMPLPGGEAPPPTAWAAHNPH